MKVGWGKENRCRGLWQRFCCLGVRDNDCSGYEDARTKFERKACLVAQKSLVTDFCNNKIILFTLSIFTSGTGKSNRPVKAFVVRGITICCNIRIAFGFHY